MSIENKEINTQTNESTPDLLVKNLETQNKEVFNFFGFSDKDIDNFSEKQEVFKKLKLNFWKILLWYRKYINENLSGLNPVIINKIKKSIKIKVLNSANKIDDILEEAKENNENIVNYRWVINERIWDELWFINYKLLPTANLYLNKDNVNFWYFDKSVKIEEIEEMFEAKVDNDWDFDEWFFSTQIIFDYENSLDSRVLEYNKIDKVIWVDMLSEKDRQIEGIIMAKYLAFVWTMLLPYLWAISSIPSDLNDVFSDYEWTIKTMKAYGILSWEELEYIMDKSYIDNIAWLVWIIATIFWAQWAIKWLRSSKIFIKLEKLGFSLDEISNLVLKYSEWIKTKVLKWKELTKSWIKSVLETKNKIKLNPDELIQLKAKIKKDIDLWSLKKEIWLSYRDIKYELNLKLSVDDKFIDNPEYMKLYTAEYFNYLKENLTGKELNKLELIFSNNKKNVFTSEKASIDLNLSFIEQISINSKNLGIKASYKVQPDYIKTKTWEEVVNYFTIAEIIAKSSERWLQDFIALWTRWDIDSMANISMVTSLSDWVRFSQYDTIVHNAILRFNNSHNPSKFIQDIYLAVKDSKEFTEWTKEVYWNKKSSLESLTKILDKKWWVTNDKDRTEFIWKMWRAFDGIEYYNKDITSTVLRRWLSRMSSLQWNIKSILEKNWLKIWHWWESDIKIKLIDRWVVWKDNLLKWDKIHNDFKWVTEKAWFQVQLTLMDEYWKPYEWWLFIPLKTDWRDEIMRPEFIYKEIDAKNDKINLLKWLVSSSDLDTKLLEKIIDKIDENDILKLENEWFIISPEILRLYWNLVENWYYKKTNFYDFVKHAPKDIRILSELDTKTILSAKVISKYNDFSFNSQKFEKVPSHYVSVFHYTTLDWLKDIAIEWLIPRWILIEKDIYVAANASPLNVKIAKDYDENAVDWVTRSGSVFAYMSKKMDWEDNYGKWWVCLEMKVDPKKVYVADADEVTDDFRYLSEYKIRNDYESKFRNKDEVVKTPKVSWKNYRWKMITLYEYNKLTPEKQKDLFRHPEVVIPWWVEKDLIRVVTASK